MLLHLPIVLASMFTPVAATETVPNFDIVRECRFEGGSAADVSRCSDDEGAALRLLQNSWAQFGDADKKSCIASTMVGGFASYVELKTCLDMAQEVETERASPPDQKVTGTVRPSEPGVTVGVGHNPNAPQPAPGKNIR
jgi:hypothetical protein